ncbi:Uncharacterized protein SCG7086_BG_00170 [Chlamydiales bacterium SCGC AG-110-P3]|nr:Uncharacterized protein SCG7086_BG_00170 [Chlamydiales bacterium SCGC AG-110-P3]
MQFLRFASVSAQPEHKSQLIACKDWLCGKLKAIGLDVQEWATNGHPTVFASWMGAGPDQPTLLLYGHYDVQPVDPIELWDSKPFEPEIRDGEVYARGACDNKGQCFYCVQAIRGLLERDGKLPINVKLVIEGEEEVGSSGLSGILESRRSELAADYLAIVDAGIPAPDTPAVTLGTRGIVTMTVEAQGSTTDMHSGSHGGVVYNPLHALVEVLASLRNSDGQITVEGFYDQVVPLQDSQRDQISFEWNTDNYKETFGALPSGGEQQYSPAERAWTRPTLEINGISGGYRGEGFKTVIPAKAVAKISCRLVGDQDPLVIGNAVKDHIENRAPEGISLTVSVHPGVGKAVQTSPSSPAVQAFAAAYTEVFGKDCQYIMEGGSIPIIPELAAASSSEVVILGVGLPDDKIHAPNEHFGVDRLEKGYLIIARAIEKMAK